MLGMKREGEVFLTINGHSMKVEERRGVSQQSRDTGFRVASDENDKHYYTGLRYISPWFYGHAVQLLQHLTRSYP